jgi:hypothetical protein
MCVQLHGGERAPLVCTCEFIDESQMLFYGWVARLLDVVDVGDAGVRGEVPG